MVDAALSGLSVHIKVLEVVVKVNGACAKIASEEGSVCGKDGRNIYPSLLTEGKGNTGQPFVELSNDGSFLLVENVLYKAG
jgi:hypothetical protein